MAAVSPAAAAAAEAEAVGSMMFESAIQIVYVFQFLSIFVIIGLIYLFIQREQKKKIARFNSFATQHGYNLVTQLEAQVQLVRSSFRSGSVLVALQGILSKSKNNFTCIYQSETRKKGKNSVTYDRTIFAVIIPDTQLQLIINSRLANDIASGGNLSNYSEQQKFELEGEFGEFYDVYMPEKSQSESLTLLTPDVMMYLLTELARYDIEIYGDTLYLYAYTHEKMEEIEKLIRKIDYLVSDMKLKPTDVRIEHNTNAIVARTATSSQTSYKKLQGRNPKLIGSILIAVIIIMQFLPQPYLFLAFGIFIICGIAWALHASIRQRNLESRHKKFIMTHASNVATLPVKKM